MADSQFIYLDGDNLANALISGIHRVIDEQDYLNRINVFPVADGDTGTNLTLSLGAALDVLNKPGEKHLGTLLAAVADALLDSSRGNSGAIIAQFFQGVSDSAGDLTRFTTVTFGEAVARGREYAYDALSEPREGTILSTIAAFADSVRRQASTIGEDDFAPVIDRALQLTNKALAHTTAQLEVLRKAGVVDAGAKGFVALVTGMAEFILHRRIAEKPDMADFLATHPTTASDGSDADSEYQYCIECIVTGAEIDRRKLREALSEVGNSFVLAGTKRKAKAHIHANDPDEVFSIARRYGKISAEKADDMHRQQHSSHNATSRFAVITDSVADIADDDLERLDIHMVPARIQFGDRGYLDKVSITAEEFYAELDSNPHYPTTSQPSPGDYRRQFQFLASHFSDVIALSVTARASGALQAAHSAAGRVDGPGKIHVVDSRNASMGQGLLAIFAAECAQAGLGVDETLVAIDLLIPETRTYALLRDLRHAVRGGRVPKSLQTIAKLFRLTPIIRTVPDGRVATSGFLLGKRNRLQKFSRFIARRTPPDQPLNVAIGHALCRDDAAVLERHLRDRVPSIHKLTITDLGAGLGVHGGCGMLIVSTQPHKVPGEVST